MEPPENIPDSGQAGSSERAAGQDADPDAARAESDNGDAGGRSDGRPFYKRPKMLIVGGAVLVAVLVAILLLWLHARRYQSTNDAFIDAHIVRVAPQVSGIVSRVAVKPNQHVEPGDLLVIINADQSRAQLQQRLATQTQAQARLGEAQAGVKAAQAQFLKTQAQAVGPAAEALKARQDLNRLLALRKADSAAVAPTRIDQAKAALRQTKGQALAARRAVAAAATQVASARKQAGAAAAQMKVAKAQVAEARIILGENRLVASVPGHIAKMNVNVGSYVSPGTQIMALVPDRMWVTANFKETQIQHIRPGQHVDIKVDAFPGVHFKGVVDSIQRGAGQAFQLLPPQNASGNFVKVVQRVPVRILFTHPNPDRYPIGPGMSVTPSVKVR